MRLLSLKKNPERFSLFWDNNLANSEKQGKYFFSSSEYMSLPYIWPPTPADTISGTL